MSAETYFRSVNAVPRRYIGLDQHKAEAGGSGR
jgi:hypothetical protein